MSAPVADKLDKLLGAVLESEARTRFSDDMLMENLPNIDSLRYMQLFTAIETEMGVKLEATDMMEVETVGDLRRLLFGDSGGAV